MDYELQNVVKINRQKTRNAIIYESKTQLIESFVSKFVCLFSMINFWIRDQRKKYINLTLFWSICSTQSN